MPPHQRKQALVAPRPTRAGRREWGILVVWCGGDNMNRGLPATLEDCFFERFGGRGQNSRLIGQRASHCPLNVGTIRSHFCHLSFDGLKQVSVKQQVRLYDDMAVPLTDDQRRRASGSKGWAMARKATSTFMFCNDFCRSLANSYISAVADSSWLPRPTNNRQDSFSRPWTLDFGPWTASSIRLCDNSTIAL